MKDPEGLPLRRVVLVVALCICTATPLAAQPKLHATPVPGGHNQLTAVAGTWAGWTFNGEVRVKPVGFLPSKVFAGRSDLVVLFANGTAKAQQFGVNAVIADRDGVSTAISTSNTLWTTTLAPGAAHRMVYEGIDFTKMGAPDHVLFTFRHTYPDTPAGRPVRVRIPTSALSGASPAPTSTP